MKENTTDIEQEQCLRISEGDETAFAEFYRALVPQLLPYIRSLVRTDAVADEVIQETFLRVWLSRDRLSAVQNPRGWVFRIASNLCYTHVRRAITERNIVAGFEKNEEAEDVAHKVQAGELLRLIHEAIKGMPPQRRKIYRLSRERGLSINEIAEELHISRSTVKNTISSSLDDIRSYLSRHGYTLPVMILMILVYRTTL